MRAPEFWSRPRRGVVSTLLQPLAMIYTAAGRLRRAATQPARAPCPVICVGNFTAGGAGKTPVALALAARCAVYGARPMFLTRGYRGRERGPLVVDSARHTAADIGDEALLLARRAPTIVSADRARGAQLAEPGNILIMDDGFQNPALRKDLSLVVVDGEAGIGNGAVIPAGPLREPLTEGLARADALVLMGADTLPPALAAVAGDCPVLRARLAPDPSAAKTLSGARVVAFAGIGRPEKFFRTLMECGANLADAIPFADHHVFSAADLDRLRARANALQARLVTTEKDLVRLAPRDRADIAALPITATFDADDLVDALLAPLFSRSPSR